MLAVVLWVLVCLPLLVALLMLRSPHHLQPSFLHRLLPSSLSSADGDSSFTSSSCSSSSSPARRVLVVGGSFAGLTFCRELLHRLPPPSSSDGSGAAVEVTLVEPRDWFEYTPGVLRAVVRPSHHSSLLTAIRHTSSASDSRFVHVQAVCAALSHKAALVVRGGEEEKGEGEEERWLPFDFCVLAVGSGYSEHIKQHDTTAAQHSIAATGTGIERATEAGTQQQQPQQHSAAAADGNERAAAALHTVPVLAPPCRSATDIAPSSVCPSPSSAPSVAQRLSALSSVHNAVQASEEVLIVGAGLVGVVRAIHHSGAAGPYRPTVMAARCAESPDCCVRVRVCARVCVSQELAAEVAESLPSKRCTLYSKSHRPTALSQATAVSRLVIEH